MIIILIRETNVREIVKENEVMMMTVTIVAIPFKWCEITTKYNTVI